MSCRSADALFSFVDGLTGSKSIQDVSAALSRMSADLGMESFAISGIPRPGESIKPYIMLDGWPQEWASRYANNHYVHHDPVIRRTLKSNQPFIWSEVNDGELTDKSTQVMGEAREFGMLDGFTVPIHSAAGFHAIVTFSSRSVDLSERERRALHMSAIFAHGRIKELMSSEEGNSSSPVPIMTARERDCISWCAAGKTTWEIAQILGIATKTVEHHIANAGRKLDVVNRAQLVAESLRRGLIG